MELFTDTRFKNWRKLTANQVNDGIDRPPNFILKGDNLPIMQALLPDFGSKIKLIYIDPPYNTGSGAFWYNDRREHDAWLDFMKTRLEVAWQLLAEDGAIFIQTDDAENAYLKVLCDELFGRELFREHIVLKSSTESGVNAVNVKRGERLFKVKEHILFYSKSKTFRFKPFFTKAPFNFNYKYEVIENEGVFSVRNLSQELSKEELEKYCLKHPNYIFSLEKNIKKAGEKFKAFAATNKEKGVVEVFNNAFNKSTLVYDGGVLVPLKERIVVENGQNYFGILASDLWVDIGTTPAHEGGIRFPNGKKNEKLLRRIMEMASNTNEYVLDFFLGSGTTAAVAHKLGRNYIGIELQDYGQNDSLIRIKNVIEGEQSGISKSCDWRGGGQCWTATFEVSNTEKHNEPEN